MKTFLKNKLKLIFENIFVEECISCYRIGKMICDDCLELIAKENKFKRDIGIDWIDSGLDYRNPIIKNLFHNLKYRHNRLSAKYIAILAKEEFLNFLESKKLKDNTIVIPVPISEKRKRSRDYNQSELIAQNLKSNIKDLDIIIINNLISRQKHSLKFSHLMQKEERQEMIKNSFKINFIKNTSSISDINIIIFDDIATTGATIYELRKTLIQSGFNKDNIFAFAVAH